MKLSPILCASVVALAALSMSAGGAFAASYSTTKSTVKTNAVKTTAPAHSSGHPKKQFQSTTVNTSRSNIKNN